MTTHEINVVKNVRCEAREDRRGVVRERIITTWDLVENGILLSEWDRQRDALAERYRLYRLHSDIK